MTEAMILEAKEAIEGLLIYRPLKSRTLLQRFAKLLENPQEQYPSFFSYLTQRAIDNPPGLECLWQSFFLEEVITAENLFTLSSESGDVTAQLQRVAKEDLARLEKLFHFDFSKLLPQAPSLRGLVASQSKRPFGQLVLELAHHQTWPEFMPQLISFYRLYGAGELCRYTSFRWEGKLVGIPAPDPITFEELVGIEEQKAKLRANTQQFLQGLPANFALLHGARGTGKSSLVKATCNYFAPEGLHLVEVPTEELLSLPSLFAKLGKRKAKFIVFIDDLSFEDEETEYKALKASLEGSAQSRATNILIYATSNRRHLIAESFQEREELHGADTIQEKLSLSDRFGLKLVFPPLSQEEYLEIVQQQAGDLPLSVEELQARALSWERSGSGRSGRLAQQFVASLKGELGSS